MQNFYAPKKLKVIRVLKETADTKTFVLGHTAKFIPGQFFMAGLAGAGESPISISGGLTGGRVCLTVKQVGNVTREIHKLKKGGQLFIRGPFGRGFDTGSLSRKEILIVAGGLGIAPLRPLINYIFSHRQDFGRVHILYGARTPRDILFKKDLKAWSGRKDTELLITVDSPSPGWKYNKGVVTGLLRNLNVNTQNAAAVVCGPPLMMRYAVYNLLEMKLNPSQIILSLERHMECGIGKCGHCYIGERFACLDGPVFTYSQLLTLRPEIEL